MTADLQEALRYLGVRGPADETLLAQMRELSCELTRRIQPRWQWRCFPLEHSDGELLLSGNIPLSGNNAALMLAECDQCVLLACTLGAEYDMWLRQLQRRDMTRAVMLDALGSSLVEAACDAASAEIAARFPASYLTDRFSPGYGDLPLALHPQLLQLVEAQRIGLGMTPSFLLTPQKSVTAIIGIAPTPQRARIRGCAHCSLSQTCTLRKAGINCVL
jgi:hypothetical protein